MTRSNVTLHVIFKVIRLLPLGTRGFGNEPETGVSGSTMRRSSPGPRYERCCGSQTRAPLAHTAAPPVKNPKRLPLLRCVELPGGSGCTAATQAPSEAYGRRFHSWRTPHVPAVRADKVAAQLYPPPATDSLPVKDPQILHQRRRPELIGARVRDPQQCDTSRNLQSYPTTATWHARLWK